MKERVVGARGQLVTFRPQQIARAVADIRAVDNGNIRKLSKAIRDVCETLVEFRLVEVLKKTGRGKIFAIRRDSLLFKVLQIADETSLKCIAEKITYFMVSAKKHDIDEKRFIEDIVSCIDAQFSRS